MLTRSGLIIRRYSGCGVHYKCRESGIEGDHVNENTTLEAGGVVGIDIRVLNLRSREIESKTERTIQRVVYAIEPSRISLEAVIQDHTFLV